MATSSGVRVRLPAVFRPAADGQAQVRVEGRTVAEALAALCRAHPALAAKLLGADGRPRRYVSVFVNDEDARQLGGPEAPLREGDELTIVPAISGGSAHDAGAAAPDGPALLALGAIAALAERSPGEEVCGFVLAAQGGGPMEVLPVRNAAADPARAFSMNPADVLRVLRLAESGGRVIAALYHSHVCGGAGLSAADVAHLTVDGGPVVPGAELWIAGLSQGKAAEVRAYRWAGSGWAERFRCVEPFTARECAQGAGRV